MTRNPVGDREDFSATYWSAILNAHANEAVVSGCAPSKGSGDFDVDIASGEVVVGGTQVSVSSTTISLSTSASDDRVDIIHVDDTGTVSSTEGTAATNPTAPDIPSGEVLLSTVLVEGGASDLNSSGSTIADYRTIYVGGRAAKTVSSNTTTSDEEIIGVDTSSSAQTITLATADAYLGKEIVIFDTADNASSNNITVDTEGSETIDPGGASSKTITVDGGFIRLYSDGTDWYAEGRAIDAETISTDEANITNETLVDAFPSSDTNINSGTWTTVPFDSTNKDERGEFDTTNNKFVPDDTGWYIIQGTVRFDSPSDTDTLQVRFRDTTSGDTIAQYEMQASGTGKQSVLVQVVRELSSGNDHKLQAQNVVSSDTIKGNGDISYLTIRSAFR